jgi:hypothetical protein
MKTLKKNIIIVALVLAAIPTMAQHYGRPTYHDSYADYYFSLGYQHLNHPTGVYNAGSFQMEVLYSFAGGKAGVTYGNDYISYSPFGLLWFMPGMILDGINNLSPQEGMLFLLPALATAQFHIPLSDHMEISAGWDALKITKLKNYNDAYYLSGSLNAGVNIFIGDVFFINAYYEYNHAHNSIAKFMDFGMQPTELNGHSFGFRLGAMISRMDM